MNTNSPVLLVEDNHEDTEATLRAFSRVGLSNQVFHCDDGEDALDFLYRRGEYASAAEAPRPCLILLDLNLPGTDGREVLSVVKQDEQLKNIPVLVLTTSNDERDIESCYRMGANCYISKPVDFGKLVRSIQHVKGFWFETVVLPRGEAGVVAYF